MADERPEDGLAEVLAAHEMRQRLVQSRWVLVCRCGEWVTDYDFDERSEEQQDAHRAHLAAQVRAHILATLDDPALRDAMAEAIWTTSRADEGTISYIGANVVRDAALAAVRAHLTGGAS